jgi:hypothetical protein
VARRSDLRTPVDDPVWERLESQIAWYDKGSVRSQRMFKALKFTTLAAGATIPLVAGMSFSTWITGGLGVVVVLVEGVLSMNEYHAHWIAYRSTCEALKHEKFLYLGKAGPYAAAPDPRALLAERVESLVSQEHAKWVSAQEQAALRADRSRDPE